MPKRKPSQRRHPEKTPQQPRDRLAEIRAEIQDVQQQIETKRRDGRVIRTAEDFKSLERAIAALTNRLSALLMAEATQVALDDSENRPRPAPWLKGRVTRSRIKADATSRSGRRAARSSSGRPTSAATVTAVRRARGCTRCSCSGACMTIAAAAIVSEISKLVAMLSSLEEVEQVLSDRGRPLDYKTTRTIAYRFATRARACPSVGALELGRDRRGPSRGRLHRWRPDSDSHDQARSQERPRDVRRCPEIT